MREDGFDNKIDGIVASFSSYSGSVIAHLRALVRENFVSLAIKAAMIFVSAMVVLIAVSFLMFGAAKGLSRALAVDLWLGLLITGGCFLLPTLLILTLISLRAKKESREKKAEQKKAAETLSRTISEIVDIRGWVQEYPLYSTGAAAAAGFTLSGVITSDTFKKSNVEEPSAGPHPAGIQASIVSMFMVLAEDVLKEAVLPLLKEHLVKPKDEMNTQDPSSQTSTDSS